MQNVKSSALVFRGWVAEWFKAHAWKVCVGLKAYREFESLPIRHNKKAPLFGVFFYYKWREGTLLSVREFAIKQGEALRR